MRALAPDDFRHLMSATGLIRLLLVLLATPAVVLGAAAGAALALACVPLALMILSVRSVVRIGRPARS